MRSTVHVARVASRVNSLSGVASRDDPTILAWELANELSAHPRDRAALVRWVTESELATFSQSQRLIQRQLQHVVALGPDRRRHAAEREQGVLQPGTQRPERLAERELDEVPARERHHEVEEYVHEQHPGDRHAELRRVREIQRAHPPDLVHLREEHLLHRPMLGAPIPEPPLQRSKLPRLEPIRSLLEKILIRDREAARGSLARILGWDFDRVIVDTRQRARDRRPRGDAPRLSVVDRGLNTGAPAAGDLFETLVRVATIQVRAHCTASRRTSVVMRGERANAVNRVPHAHRKQAQRVSFNCFVS